MRLMTKALGAALVLALGTAAHADMIVGSVAGGGSANPTGTNSVGTANGLASSNGAVSGSVGDYASYITPFAFSFPNFTGSYFTSTALTFTTVGSSVASSYTLAFYDAATNALEGTFVASSQVQLDKIQYNNGSSQADLYMLGTFTPAGSFASAFDPTYSSLSLSITQSYPGAAANFSYSLASPPVPLTVPVPPSIVMGLTSALGLGTLARFRRRLA